MMGFGFIGTILVIALVAYLLGWRPQENQNIFSAPDKKQSPLEILKARYALGEINKQDFEQMREDLARN